MSYDRYADLTFYVTENGLIEQGELRYQHNDELIASLVNIKKQSHLEFLGELEFVDSNFANKEINIYFNQSYGWDFWFLISNTWL